jgi:hypothetical protein
VIPTAIPVLCHDTLTTDKAIIKSGTIKNGDSRKNHAAISYRSKVIYISGFEGAMLNSSCRLMSGTVNKAPVDPGVVQNKEVVVGIVFISISVQKFFFYFRSTVRHFEH